LRLRIRVSCPAEDSHSGLVRTLGKRVGCKPSRVRISYPPLIFYDSGVVGSWTRVRTPGLPKIDGLLRQEQPRGDIGVTQPVGGTPSWRAARLAAGHAPSSLSWVTPCRIAASEPRSASLRRRAAGITAASPVSSGPRRCPQVSAEVYGLAGRYAIQRRRCPESGWGLAPRCHRSSLRCPCWPRRCR
jgi:hypothetical protein